MRRKLPPAHIAVAGTSQHMIISKEMQQPTAACIDQRHYHNADLALVLAVTNHCNPPRIQWLWTLCNLQWNFYRWTQILYILAPVVVFSTLHMISRNILLQVFNMAWCVRRNAKRVYGTDWNTLLLHLVSGGRHFQCWSCSCYILSGCALCLYNAHWNTRMDHFQLRR